MAERPSSEFFSGPDRLEVLKSFGRPIRIGSLDELRSSDASRIRAAIQAKDFADAGHRLQLLQPIHSALITTYLEWAYAMRSFTAARHTAPRERDLAAASFDTWTGGVT